MRDRLRDRHRAGILILLAALAVIPYLPTLAQPLIEDDFPNLTIALQVGSPHKLAGLATSVYRLRATSEWLMCALYHLFGMHAVGYHAVSIALHVLNTLLVYALGAWPPLDYKLSIWAAGFFAIAEGHQEAIMWFSGCNELLIFLFGMLAFVAAILSLWATPRRAAAGATAPEGLRQPAE